MSVAQTFIPARYFKTPNNHKRYIFRTKPEIHESLCIFSLTGGHGLQHNVHLPCLSVSPHAVSVTFSGYARLLDLGDRAYHKVPSFRLGSSAALVNKVQMRLPNLIYFVLYFLYPIHQHPALVLQVYRCLHFIKIRYLRV